jgi:hypothetical protein
LNRQQIDSPFAESPEAKADREYVEWHNALVYARQHLKTHVRWKDYLRRGGELPHEKVGDLEHHEQAIRELDTICTVLRRAEPQK